MQEHTASAASHRDEGPEISSDWRFSQIQTGVLGIPPNCQGAEVLDWSPHFHEQLFYHPRGDFIIFKAVSRLSFILTRISVSHSWQRGTIDLVNIFIFAEKLLFSDKQFPN